MVNQNDNPGVMTRDKDRAIEDAAADADLIAKYSARFGDIAFKNGRRGGGDAFIGEVKEVIKEVEVEVIKEVVKEVVKDNPQHKLDIAELNDLIEFKDDTIKEFETMLKASQTNEQKLIESVGKQDDSIKKLKTQVAKYKKALSDD